MMDRETVYSDDPVRVALRWASLGAELVHLVDLDAAAKGRPVNFEVIKRIVSSINVPVQIGGGIRNLGSAEKYLSLDGVKRIIIGTAAIENEHFVKSLIKKNPGRVAVGIDARDGKVAIKGWLTVTDMAALDLSKRLEGLGVSCIIYTDISRDGMLTGPNVEATKTLKEAVDIPVIASGGVSKIEDIDAIKETGVEGVIIGKALYSGSIELEEALERARS
jgi:phosphoribosylformimino-5-aminoimidazole carboxamide ribotide isomerase